jgi:hypothetical protein
MKRHHVRTALLAFAVLLSGWARADLAGPVSAAAVARARQAIFSPESGAVLSADEARRLDTNHDGVVTLEDLNGLGGSHSKWTTLFFAPEQPGNFEAQAPEGSYRHPFILTEDRLTADGGFYDQVRKVTFATDKKSARNAEIIFLPGTYRRIQLLLRNADTAEEPASVRAHYAVPIKAVIDRFHPARLLLRSLDPLGKDPEKTAFFFGESLRDGPAGLLKYGPALRLKTDAIDGANPMFLQIQGVNQAPHPRKISGIVVDGLKVAGYRSGMDLLYAERIVLKNNRLETLGSARTAAEIDLPDAKTTAMYGTYAIGMARFCQDILVKNNRIDTTWNRDLGATKNPGGDLGLMHPFYIIDAGDAVFMDNRAENSSGPLFKVVDTVSYRPDGTVAGSQTAALRQVIIHNDFRQATDRLAGIYPIDFNVMAMIHDNSAQVHFLPDKKIYTQPSPPAPNLIFLGNTWETEIRMDFLRRESETTSAAGVSASGARFPKWLFEGNTWIGFTGGPRIVERERGTLISVKKDITQEVVTDPHESVRLVSSPAPWTYAQAAARLRELVLGNGTTPGAYRSGNAKVDQLLVDIVEKQEIPGVSTDK